MYATGNKKMLNMLILEILTEYSDEDHRLTQQDIIKLLKQNYDMECDRRSVKNNILYLKELGYEISMEDGYYLMRREFEDAELRMLIDSVLFSKHLTQKQAQGLIDKLRSKGNRYFPAKVSHITNLPDMQHGDNKQLMYVLDAVNDAISDKKKIRFIYNEYGIDFKLKPRKQGGSAVNPYQIVASNGFYYLIGNYDQYDNIVHFRMDKITNVEILDEKVKSEKDIKEFAKGYSLPKHMAEHIYMFGGESVRVKFLTPEYMMDALIDWFGKNFRVRKVSDSEMIEVTVQCNENAMFYWALQYGPYVEVVEPLDLREKIIETLDEMSCRYRK